MDQPQKTVFQQISFWFEAIRPPSLTAATVPVLAGAAWAFHEKTPANWRWLPLIWLAAVSIQAATNLVSEYFDYLKGNITHGSTRVIVQGHLLPRQFLIGGLVLFALAAAIGLAFIALRGWPIMVIGLVGILGGYFYTATPVGYKYFGLGDIFVFILMGPLMVIGSYFVLTGNYNNNVLWISLPIGCLVAAILSGNNLRDLLPDSRAGVTTTAGLMGFSWARIEYSALDISAYLITAFLILVDILPVWSLITILSFPLAYRCIRRAFASEPNKPEQLATLDIQTAQLHLAFGLLLVAGLLISPASAQSAGKTGDIPLRYTSRWNDCLSQEASWYISDEALQIADNFLLFQRTTGGWPKNIDMTLPLSKDQKQQVLTFKDTNDATIDNSATTEQLKFLARVYSATKRPDILESFNRGLDYLFAAQYPNGGWPQFYPKPQGYQSHITFNDNAMINVMDLLQNIVVAKKPYDFIDAARKEKAKQAVAKGIDCIIKCQIVHDSKRLAWCAQHDEVTFEPQLARIYEKISISGMESVGIVRFLMRIENPGPEVIQAVESAVQWFQDARLTGFRYDQVQGQNTPKGYDYIVVEDPTAPPLWARFYEIGTNKPMFCDRDGIVRDKVSKLSAERRSSYSWYVEHPRELIDKDYPAWKKKLNVAQPPSAVL